MTAPRVSRFRRDLAHSIGSSGAGFAITLVTTPLMTRLFPAEAYGTNGMVMTAATLLSAVCLFGLPVALEREQPGIEQTRLLNASAQLAVILSAVCALAVGAVWVIMRATPSGLTAAVAWLFPLLVLAQAAQRISDSLVTARGLFPPLAVARIGNAATARLLTLGAGWLFYAGAATMMLGDVVGRLVHLTVSARGGGLGPEWRRLRCWPKFAVLRGVLREYSDFAFHSNIASLLPMVTVLGLQALIGLQLGTAAVGQYVLAQSILSLPVSLIALASSPVLFQRFLRAAAETPARLPALVLKAMLSYALLGTFLMLPLAIFGPTLFAFVFGEDWRPAGAAAAVLSLPQALAFSLTALLSLFNVTRRVRAWLRLELMGVVLVLGGFSLASPVTDLPGAANRLALLGFGYQILMHAGCLWAARSAVESKQ